MRSHRGPRGPALLWQCEGRGFTQIEISIFPFTDVEKPRPLLRPSTMNTCRVTMRSTLEFNVGIVVFVFVDFSRCIQLQRHKTQT